jgi:IMP dehydrogenase
MPERSPRVGEYMSEEVATVAPEASVGDVAERMLGGDHSGFPVMKGRHVVGYVSARDLLGADDDDPVADAMSEDPLVASPDMAVQDAARVILRAGIQKLPVVDDEGRLLGIIANADVIRSQIERATPDKADKLTRTLSTIHDVDAEVERREIELADLKPSQATVYADELEGRIYELKRGLAEPLLVIDNRGVRPPDQATVGSFEASGDGTVEPSAHADGLVLADGHHRAMAARRLSIETMDAYVIALDERVDLGLAKTEWSEPVNSIEDVRIEDQARHPLVERTQRLRDGE